MLSSFAKLHLANQCLQSSQFCIDENFLKTFTLALFCQILRELERVEAQQNAELCRTKARLEQMEKFVDDVQARLRSQVEEMDLRLTNDNNLERCETVNIFQKIRGVQWKNRRFQPCMVEF